MLQFSSLRLSEPILRALADEGYLVPTPIQAQAIPPVLEGRDLLGCAQTGTGKTAAFALPIIQRLMESRGGAGPVRGALSGNGHHGAKPASSPRGAAPSRLPRALVLSPTRELAVQIEESFTAYGRHANLAATVVYGGVSQVNQVRALQRGVDVVVATPGRLIDLMEQRLVNLANVEVLVLDEADRMLDMGFIDPVRRIAAALVNRRQTLLFSATMPREILRLAETLLRDPVRVAVTPVASTVSRIEQSVYMVDRAQKPALLEHLLERDGIGRALVFTRTKHGADRLSKRLNAAGISSDAIHGDKAQNARQRALTSFRSGRSRVLVATDVAARGIDVDGITHVFNYDLPHEPEAYVHRIGRTARAGASGIAIAFCDGEERVFLRDIEKLTGQKVQAIAKLPALAARPARPPLASIAGAAPDARVRGHRADGGAASDRTVAGRRSASDRSVAHAGHAEHAGHVEHAERPLHREGAPAPDSGGWSHAGRGRRAAPAAGHSGPGHAIPKHSPSSHAGRSRAARGRQRLSAR